MPLHSAVVQCLSEFVSTNQVIRTTKKQLARSSESGKTNKNCSPAQAAASISSNNQLTCFLRALLDDDDDVDEEDDNDGTEASAFEPFPF